MGICISRILNSDKACQWAISKCFTLSISNTSSHLIMQFNKTKWCQAWTIIQTCKIISNMAANSSTGPRNNRKYKSTVRGPEVDYPREKGTRIGHNRESKLKESYSTTRSHLSRVRRNPILLSISNMCQTQEGRIQATHRIPRILTSPADLKEAEETAKRKRNLDACLPQRSKYNSQTSTMGQILKTVTKRRCPQRTRTAIEMRAIR